MVAVEDVFERNNAGCYDICQEAVIDLHSCVRRFSTKIVVKNAGVHLATRDRKEVFSFATNFEYFRYVFF